MMTIEQALEAIQSFGGLVNNGIVHIFFSAGIEVRKMITGKWYEESILEWMGVEADSITFTMDSEGYVLTATFP